MHFQLIKYCPGYMVLMYLRRKTKKNNIGQWPQLILTISGKSYLLLPYSSIFIER